MILRRIKAHVEKENWFAVGIDFAIVVLGVFIGIQVANWNAVRAERVSEAQYLDRLADEIELTIAQIEEEQIFSKQAIEIIEVFTSQLYQTAVSDEDLLSATQDYFSQGAFFTNLRPYRTTFDDLISTGNLDIIEDEAIRASLIRLYADYDDAQNTIASNIVWIQQGEDRIYYTFDAFRFDGRTEVLFEDTPLESLAEDIRQNRDVLRRYAAFHYWLKARSVELYEDVEPQAQAVLDLIKAEQGQ